MARTVARISVTPVKGFALLHPEEIELTAHGAVENRRFLLVDADGNRLRSSLTAWPIAVQGSYDPAGETLRMRFPDGHDIEGEALGTGPPWEVDYRGHKVSVQAVEGAWNERLSELAGHPVRVARPERLGEAQEEPVTFLSLASVERLAQEAGGPVDPRRFRMLIDLDGCEPHEEDGWDGRQFTLGSAVVRVRGPVARCAATTRDPDTGVRDLDTLKLIKGYRGQLEGGEIPFGVYAQVDRPGRVRVGDALEPL